MGYSTRPELVVENEMLLQMVEAAVREGETLVLGTSGNVSTEQYKLRRILAAAERHPEACGGRYVNLSSQVTLRVHGNKLSIVPKLKIGLSKARHTEVEELERIRRSDSSTEMLRFEPSENFSEEKLFQSLKEMGWIPHRMEMDGEIVYAAERPAKDRKRVDLSNL